MNIFRKTTVLLAASLAGSFYAAHAIPIPGAHGSLGYEGTGNSFTGTNASATFGCGSVSVSGGPVPVLTATASGCVDDVQAILIYYFSVVGPTGTVPVVMRSSSMATQTGANQAGYSLSAAVGTQHVDNCLLGYINSGCGSHAYTDYLSLDANSIYHVTMMTIVSRFLGSGTGFSMLDPFFTIDPTFENAGAYAFEFSAGIGNNPNGEPPVVETPVGVPEPGTLVLMGFGLLGMAVVRKRARRANLN